MMAMKATVKIMVKEVIPRLKGLKIVLLVSIGSVRIASLMRNDPGSGTMRGAEAESPMCHTHPSPRYGAARSSLKSTLGWCLTSYITKMAAATMLRPQLM